jgi:hypothetical protein
LVFRRTQTLKSAVVYEHISLSTQKQFLLTQKISLRGIAFAYKKVSEIAQTMNFIARIE